MGKTEGKRLLERSRRRWEGKIKLNLREIGRCVMDWTGLAKDRDQWMELVNILINFRVP
jgi:hypothetical protein